ncbi:hypothetical protein HC891_02550 [Candidatus Gracilibacteria bacterium]|nr:hypothetical protein [Candidatus Gracilibacteria bacterium]
MSPHFWRPVVLFCLLLASYGYVLPRWSDWNQNSRLNLVLALVDDGTVVIDRYVANTGDYALIDGRAYTDKPPGASFLGVPVYMALRPVLDLPVVAARLERLSQGAAFGDTLQADGTGLQAGKVRFALVQYVLSLAVVAVPAALLGVLFFRTLRRLGVGEIPAILGTLGYALGTAAAPYAGNFYSHQLTAALLFGAFFVTWQSPVQSAETQRAAVVRGLLVGLLLGWAVISEYPLVLAAALLFGYALVRHRWRWLAPMLVGGLAPGMLLAVYDYAAFGTILPVGYAHSALWQDQHQTGFMSITHPRLESIWGLTFGAFRGLFVRAPWLLLAVPGFILWWRTRHLRAEWWVLLLVPAMIFFFYSSSIMWWGGVMGAGPRYIVPMLPFFALPAAWLIGLLWSHRSLRVAATALVLLSMVLTWAEALAGQLFPPDTISTPWLLYTWPAWQSGDIARNLGMALGFRGHMSLLPLFLLVVVGVALLCSPRRKKPEPLVRGDLTLQSAD